MPKKAQQAWRGSDLQALFFCLAKGTSGCSPRCWGPQGEGARGGNLGTQPHGPLRLKSCLRVNLMPIWTLMERVVFLEEFKWWGGDRKAGIFLACYRALGIKGLLP